MIHQQFPCLRLFSYSSSCHFITFCSYFEWYFEIISMKMRQLKSKYVMKIQRIQIDKKKTPSRRINCCCTHLCINHTKHTQNIYIYIVIHCAIVLMVTLDFIALNSLVKWLARIYFEFSIEFSLEKLT